MKNKIYYEVRFIIYHYNSGDGRNGNYEHCETFHELDQAKDHKRKLQKLLQDGDSGEYCSQFCWDGHLVRVEGIWKITEEQCH